MALQKDYPWTTTPLIVSAPMARAAKPPLAVSVSRAGGLGFLAGGYDISELESHFEETVRLISSSTEEGGQEFTDRPDDVLPVGVGFISWSASLQQALPLIKKYRPCAVWLFAPKNGAADLVSGVDRIREDTAHKTKIWVQIGCVADAVDAAVRLKPDVLVVQGSDAGGHGLAQSASIISLLPEVSDALERISLPSPISLIAAGGISDGRGAAAALVLGAQGCAMGTRFLASPEALISIGYQNEILRVSDGGVSTVRSCVYDHVRGIYDWPARYDGRGVINRTYLDTIEGGMSVEENGALYKKEVQKGAQGWGPEGRMTTYAGTGVGLIREVVPAGKIVRDTIAKARERLDKTTF